jgi:hypothetical protein
MGDTGYGEIKKKIKVLSAEAGPFGDEESGYSTGSSWKSNGSSWYLEILWREWMRSSFWGIGVIASHAKICRGDRQTGLGSWARDFDGWA